MNEKPKQLLLIFAQTEREQEEYLPHWRQAVHVYIEGEEWDTDSARFATLCALCKYAKRGETEVAPVGQLLTEISSVCYIMREISGLYDWLLWHPERVCLEDAVFVDSAIYGIWNVLRRLCKLVLALIDVSRPLANFNDVIAPYLVASDE